MSVEVSTAKTGLSRINKPVIGQFSWSISSWSAHDTETKESPVIFESPLIFLQSYPAVEGYPVACRITEEPQAQVAFVRSERDQNPWGNISEKAYSSLELVDGYIYPVVPRNVNYASLVHVPREPEGFMIEYTLHNPNVTACVIVSEAFGTSSASHQIKDALDILRANEQNDWVAPTAYAYDTARSVLNECPGLKLSFVATDDQGGIRMAWRHGEKQVRVNFGAGPGFKSYIYYEGDSAHDVEPLLPANLRSRLHWLNADQ